MSVTWKKSFPCLLAIALSGPVLIAAPPAQAQYDRDRGDASLNQRITGRVRSIGRNRTTFVLETDRRQVTVVARDADLIRRDERDREIRSPFQTDDVRIGQTVAVEGDWTDTDIFHATRIRIGGTNVGSLLGDRASEDRFPDRDRTDAFIERRTDGGLTGRVVRRTGDFDRSFSVDVLGREYKVETPQGIRVRRDREPISVHDLARDDRVRIRGDWTDRNTLRARSIEAFSPNWDFALDRVRAGMQNQVVAGVIDRTDAKNFMLRLRTPDGAYDVDANAADVMDGSRIQPFASLRPGERISVFVSKQRGRTLIARRIDRGGARYLPRENRTHVSDTTTGTVEDIDRLDHSFRLRTGLTSLLVRVSGDADLVGEEGDSLDFADLQEGDEVRIVGTRNDVSGLFIADEVKMLPR
jgi:hypothetical protein